MKHPKQGVLRAMGYGKREAVNYQGPSDGRRLSALHLVCVRGAPYLIPMLLQYGANVELRDKVLR